MNRRLVFSLGGSIFLLVSAYIGVAAYDNNLHKREDLQPPNRISSYQVSGYFEVAPETILESLETGGADVFMPLTEEEALDREAISNLSIYWTQADFMKIASALGQLVWDDPMDLKEWDVFDIYLEGSCGDSIGFDFASITYFKTGKNNYTTRFIEISPHFGLASWGDGRAYPQSILQKWKSVDLLGRGIGADEAVRKVSQDAGARLQIDDNVCGVSMSSSRFDPENWHVRIYGGSLEPLRYVVDRGTGDYSLLVPDN